MNPLMAGTDPRIEDLLRSHIRFLGRPLCAPRELFDAPFVVLAHGVEASPLLFYGNRAALALWDMKWSDFVRMPSTQTAEPGRRASRAKLLADVARQGFSEHYTGIRVSSRGRRFEIQQATVWNILNSEGARTGQAATFSRYRFLDESASP